MISYNKKSILIAKNKKVVTQGLLAFQLTTKLRITSKAMHLVQSTAPSRAKLVYIF